MFAVIFGLFGLIVGSFLNVLILRHGVRPVSGRSSCPKCSAQLRWHDLVPVLSWLYLAGRCRHCGGKISIQYPTVELSTGAIFVIIGLSPLVLPLRLIALPVAAILAAIFVYDLRHKIIPDHWVWTFNILALIYSFFSLEAASYTLYTFLAGPISAFPLFFLWFVSLGRWMGFGDVKLALGIGWLLGILHGLTAIFLAFFIGAIVGLLLIYLSSSPYFLHRPTNVKNAKRYTIKSEVPFGPFLIASTLFLWFIQMHGIALPWPLISS